MWLSFEASLDLCFILGTAQALLRRAQLNEKLDNLDDALRDLNSSLEIDPSLHSARRDAHRLDSIVKERNEKLKAEMLGEKHQVADYADFCYTGVHSDSHRPSRSYDSPLSAVN